MLLKLRDYIFSWKVLIASSENGFVLALILVPFLIAKSTHSASKGSSISKCCWLTVGDVIILKEESRLWALVADSPTGFGFSGWSNVRLESCWLFSQSSKGKLISVFSDVGLRDSGWSGT